MLRIDGQLKFSEYQNIYDVVVLRNHILRKIVEEIDFSFVNKMLEASKEDSFFGYKNHIAITDERMITEIEVTTGRAADTKILGALVGKSQKNGVAVEEILGDKAYSSKDNIEYCNENNIKLISRLNTVVSNGNTRDDEFIYNKDAGTMQCPEGHLAMRCDIRKGNNDNQYYTYCFSMKRCKKCIRYLLQTRSQNQNTFYHSDELFIKFFFIITNCSLR